MNWKLLYGGEEKSLAQWGIGEVTRKLRNQSMDLVTLKIPGDAIGGDLQFEPGEGVQIFRDSQRWFCGVVTKTPIYGSAGEEFRRYELGGPWWYLDNIIYQQLWKEPSDWDDADAPLNDVPKSHLILGQGSDGDPISIGEQLGEVIDYANAAVGYDVIALAEEIELPIYIPFDECKDLSCGEVIRRLLRWVPDAVTYFDYAQEVPVFHVVRREQLSPLTLDVCDLNEFYFVPRHDLRVQAVVLKFEKTHKSAGKSWKTVEVQRFPEDATGQELGALVMTIALEGTQSTSIKQDIEVELIQMSSETWWRDHLPGLKNVSNLVVENYSRGGTLPNELISGSVADWMDCSVARDIIRANISYETEDEAVHYRDVAVKINATDAQSKTYRSLVSYAGEENVPDDLAAHIYGGVSALQYEGRIVYVRAEVGGDFLGRAINVTGGRLEWESMDAVVQSVEEHLETGKTVIILGPAKHLGPDDLSELTKSNRHRVASRNFHARRTAEASGNGYVEQGKYGPMENTSYGSEKFSKLAFYAPDNEARKIFIDVGALDVDATVCLRREDVADGGVLKQRYALASEPFVESGG
ncbi:MAG: hypothetical protein LBJ81_02835 [Puniceicoccales bacterium]|nr:hypothetical protein [Puniceicoccales bacterium]